MTWFHATAPSRDESLHRDTALPNIYCFGLLSRLLHESLPAL